MAASPRIVIAGTGSIGCYVGGCLALAGKDVRFLARSKTRAALATDGLRITDLDGGESRLEPGQIEAHDDPEAALAGADIVVVAVKSGATNEMASTIDRFAPSNAKIVSLQNGVDNAGRIRAAMTAVRPVLAGMVPFNVVLSDDAGLHAHRATAGNIVIEGDVAMTAAQLAVAGMPVETSADMNAVLWGKLLLNLNNALNALSNLPLAQELSDPDWRRLLAGQMDEALGMMKANGIRPAKLAGAPPGLLPTILRLPNWLFTRIATRMLAIDPHARSSMWEDLKRGRPTEIDEFQGAILRLAEKSGGAAPLTRRVVELIREAEARRDGPPGLTPDEIRP